MNEKPDLTLKLQSLDMTPEADPVAALAAERACEARRAWREAQQLRLLTARRAERLALELKAAEEQSESRIAAARAAAVERRDALQRRRDAAARAERLERKLTRALEAGDRATLDHAIPSSVSGRTSKPRAGLYVAVAALGIAAGASVFALTAGTASPSMPSALSSASVLDGASGGPLSLKLSYRLDARRSR